MRKLLFILLLIPFWGQGQIIYTIAGTGTSGFSGDGGPALLAKLSYPEQVVFDHSGNMYIADKDNNVIRKVNTSGVISTIVGQAGVAGIGYSGDDGPATAAQLNGTTSITFDAVDNLYLTDAINNVLRKVNAAGIITTIAGTGVNGYSGDGGPATAAQMGVTYAVALDALGNIYISDENHRIRKVSTSGIISTVAGNGTNGFSGDGGPATAAQLKLAGYLAVSPAGELYFSDWMNHRVRKVSASGIISTVAGNGIAGNSGDGGPATSASLSGPNSVAFDKQGNFYIGDPNAYVIRKVDTSGIITTVVGNGTAGYSGDGGPATAAQVRNIDCSYINDIGDIYLADADNHVIRVVTSHGLNVKNIQSSVHNLFVYPNPATSSLTIQSTDQPINQLTITNLLGQVTYTHEYNTEKVQIDVAVLPKGMYLIRINGSEVRKFVKE